MSLRKKMESVDTEFITVAVIEIEIYDAYSKVHKTYKFVKGRRMCL